MFRRELICTLYWVLVITLSSDGEHHCCCLLSEHFHGCPEIRLYDGVRDFGPIVRSGALSQSGIYVRIPDKTALKPNVLYTVVGFTTDSSIPGRVRGVFGWMIFLAINITGGDLIRSDVYKLNSIVPLELGSCEDLYDVEVELRVALFEQFRAVKPRLFDTDLDMVKKYNMTPATNLVEFETFRRKDQFKGPPKLIKMYTLRKCSKTYKLSFFLQAFEYRGEARELQSYHFQASPPYRLNDKLMENIHTKTIVTLHMVEYELTECSFRADLTLMEGPTALTHRKNPCPRLDLRKYLENVISLGREGIYARQLQRKFDEYFINLAQYSRTIRRLIKASDEYKPRVDHSKSEKPEDEDCQGVHPAFARMCWIALFRQRRLAIKMDLIGEVLKNLTGKWPDIPDITDVED